MTFRARCHHRIASICMTLAGIALLLCPALAWAYIGPGIAFGAVAFVAAFVGSVVLALLALFWYPLKRLWRRHRRRVVSTKPPHQ